jgi:hypothetical protein
VEFISREHSYCVESKIFLIIQVKKNLEMDFNIDTGFWQLLAQLRIALYLNKNQKSVYGALTSLKEWIFVKMEIVNSEKNTTQITHSRCFFFMSHWEATFDTGLALSFLFDIFSQNNPVITNKEHYLNSDTGVKSRVESELAQFTKIIEENLKDMKPKKILESESEVSPVALYGKQGQKQLPVDKSEKIVTMASKRKASRFVPFKRRDKN